MTAKKGAKRHDHREDIFAACDAATERVRWALGLADPPEDEEDPTTDVATFLNESVLEIDHMAAPEDPDRCRTRFVLGLGGPHVEVVVDSRDGVTFCHSWGKRGPRANARDLREIDVCGADRDVWTRLAAEYREYLG